MTATWLTYRYGRSARLGYANTVRVLDIRKRTARVECRRFDGTIKRRFVKLDKLIFSTPPSDPPPSDGPGDPIPGDEDYEY